MTASAPWRPYTRPQADYDIAIEWRAAGKTFREIGAHFGVTHERARQIHAKAKRREAKASSRFETSLSARTRHCLATQSIGDEESLRNVGPRAILRWMTNGKGGVPNFGFNSAREVYTLMGWEWPDSVTRRASSWAGIDQEAKPHGKPL